MSNLNPRNAGRKPLGSRAKKVITCSIDGDLKRRGKQAHVNFSQLLEQALEEYLEIYESIDQSE